MKNTENDRNYEEMFGCPRILILRSFSLSDLMRALSVIPYTPRYSPRPDLDETG